MIFNFFSLLPACKLFTLVIYSANVQYSQPITKKVSQYTCKFSELTIF